jgi:hypothetical protein
LITGYDTVLVTPRPPGDPVSAFIGDLARRWPSLRTSVDDAGFRPWSGGGTAPSPALPSDEAEILLARDEAMLAAWDEEGYHLSDDGDGPLMVAYRPCPVPRLNVLALDDPYGHTGFAYEPYEVLLIGAGLYLVTIVTPDRDSAFSREMRESLTEHLQRPAA